MGNYWYDVNLEPDAWSETINLRPSRCILWKTDDGSPKGVEFQERRGDNWVSGVPQPGLGGEFRLVADRPVAVSIRYSSRKLEPGTDASCFLAEHSVYPNGFQPSNAPDFVFLMRDGARWEGPVNADKGVTFGFFADTGPNCMYWKKAAVEEIPKVLGMWMIRVTNDFRNGRFGHHHGVCKG